VQQRIKKEQCRKEEWSRLTGVEEIVTKKLREENCGKKTAVDIDVRLLASSFLKNNLHEICSNSTLAEFTVRSSDWTIQVNLLLDGSRVITTTLF